MGLAIAQNKQVSGTVIDENGEPVVGASVIAKGAATVGTATDGSGKYAFSVPESVNRLIVRYIGYNSVEVEASLNVQVLLTSNAKLLDEVVVTALGLTREKKTLGYSITSVSGDEIANAKTVNPLQALQGKVAGLDIMSSQTPGGTQIVAIRGYNSFGNNQPLYIVDGIPITNSQNVTSGINSGTDFGSGINSINPNDIESISILKGSAASAAYGSRAAQGVIMITTKSGKDTNGKIKVEYDGGLSVQQIGRLPYEQTLFGQGWSGDRALDENGNWGARFDGKERPWGNIVGDEQLMIPNTYKKNRVRDFYDLGLGYNNSVSFLAGTDKTTFRASVSQSHVDGPIPTDDDSYDRYTIGANASHQANKLLVSTAINFSTERNEVAPTGQDNSTYRDLTEISTGLSIVDLKDFKNKFNNLDNYFTPYGLNPYQVLDMRENVARRNKFFGKLQLDWDILSTLKATYRFGGDYESSVIDKHFDAVKFAEGSPNAGSSTASEGFYSQQRIERIQVNHDLMLDYNQRFENISVNATLGANTNERSMSSLYGSITSIYIPGFYHLSNSLSPATSSQSSSLYRLWGAYLNADLGYKDYLYLTLTGRNDHSSTLPKDKNSYFYGGAMAGFIITDFLKQQNISSGSVDFAKLRLAYGRTGKDASAYAIYDKLIAATLSNPGYPSVDGLSFPIGGVNSFTLSNAAGNITLSPELTDEFEVGAELQFFGNRVGLDVSYYNKLTKGLIAGKPMDPTAGYTSFAQANIGDVRNSGVELLLSLVPIKTTHFQWDLSFNFTKNNNKVERLEVPETYLGGYGGMGIYAVEGKPIGQFKSQKALTVKIDGKEYSVVDGNGNPQPTPNEEFLGKDVNEKYRMGLTNSFTYKGLSLFATVDFRYGGYIYCYTKDYMGWVGSGPETAYNDRNPFIVPNSVVANSDGTYSENTTPVNPTAFHTFFSNGAFQYSDANVISRSYLKLRNIGLAYDLPKSLCSKLKVGKIRASLNAENILLWTPVENQYIDPEMTTFGNNIEAKFGEFGATPPFQTYVFGLSVSF
jgi:TonB-linked SusC/RagA family outer membrane protein